MMNLRKLTNSSSKQRGYTLLEILVALLIGVFLLAGLFTILQNTRRTSSNQNALALLQDQQRMAMSILTDVVQNTGYFDPNVTSANIAFATTAALATGYTMASGQALSGSDATAGDIIVSRYWTGGETVDGIINCNGATNAAATTFVNMFYIAATPSANGGYALYCSTNAANTNSPPGIPLVTGIQNMQIYYGVATTAGANNVDTYMTATDVQTASNWSKVSSVRITLTFVNPLYNQAGYTGTAKQYVYLTRVIPLQGRTGVIASQL